MQTAKAFEVNEQNFDVEVLESQQPVLVVFWEDACYPCRAWDALTSIAPSCRSTAGTFPCSGRFSMAKSNAA